MANINESNHGEKKKKKTQGKLKIEIKKIEKVSNRQVTFSKRRLGLFKKASQLCVLSGAEIAILVQSLNGKRVFTFGHKSVDSVIDRFLENRIREDSQEETGRDGHEIEYSSRVCKELEMEIKAEKGVVANDDDGGRFWWEREVDELELEELERYEAALVELMKNVQTKANLKIQTSDDTLMAANCNQIHDQVATAAAFDNFNPNFTSDDLPRFDVDHIWADFSDQYL